MNRSRRPLVFSLVGELHVLCKIQRLAPELTVGGCVPLFHVGLAPFGLGKKAADSMSVQKFVSSAPLQPAGLIEVLLLFASIPLSRRSHSRRHFPSDRAQPLRLGLS